MRKFRISGVPICENNKLVGIITNRDLKFETDFSKKISESMTSEGLITAPEGITLEEAKDSCQGEKRKAADRRQRFSSEGTYHHQRISKTDQSIRSPQRMSRVVCFAVQVSALPAT